MMKTAALIAVFAIIAPAFAQGQHQVRGYTRADGTYVAPHMQTNPNATTSDNWSTRGNVNPYTGQAGTKPDTRPAYGATYGSTFGQPSPTKPRNPF
jgi:hypothetical protein